MLASRLLLHQELTMANLIRQHVLGREMLDPRLTFTRSPLDLLSRLKSRITEIKEAMDARRERIQKATDRPIADIAARLPIDISVANAALRDTLIDVQRYVVEEERLRAYEWLASEFEYDAKVNSPEQEVTIHFLREISTRHDPTIPVYGMEDIRVIGRTSGATDFEFTPLSDPGVPIRGSHRLSMPEPYVLSSIEDLFAK